jgi:hypothetical protein
MIMMDQSKRLSEPLRWGRREKSAVAAVLACVVLAALGLGAYALTSGAPARADCIEVTFASTLGGARLHACGARAKTICSSGGYRGIEDSLRAACRHAGFMYTPARTRS